MSPLGLVEMPRQNVTDGRREIVTRKCPVCEGDGVVVSDQSVAIDVERKLRTLAASSRHRAFKVAVNDHVASLLIGAGGERLAAIEAQAKRRLVLEPRADVPHDFFEVLDQGTLEKLRGETPVEEGKELQVKLVEVGRHDVRAGIGKLDGYTVCVGSGASLIGKTVKVRVERFVDGTAYASLVRGPAAPEEPITAEGMAEKPTRKPRARKTAEAETVEAEAEPETGEVELEEPVEAEAATEAEAAEPAAPKKKTRRGSRGGRNRKKKPAAGTAEAAPEAAEEPAQAPKIHVPDRTLGREDEAAEAPEEGDRSDNGAGAPPKKRTRRGSRGGRNRRKKPASTAAGGDASGDGGGEAEPADNSDAGEYVPMSEWIDDLEANRS
jgi:ribonuclease G